MSYQLSHEVAPSRVSFRVSQDRKSILRRHSKEDTLPVADWPTFEDGRLALALGAVSAFEDANPGNVEEADDHITLTHDTVAALSESNAQCLGLPGVVPYTFQVDTVGSMALPEFSLRGRWLNAGATILTDQVGAFLKTVDGLGRIPEPIYSILKAVNSFGELDDPPIQERWSALARIKSLLDGPPDGLEEGHERQTASKQVMLEEFIEGIKVYTAAHFSLQLQKRSDGSIDFDPVLFSKEISDQRASGQEVSEKDGVLPDDLLEIFQSANSTGFREFENAKSTYLLRRGQYLIIDEALLPALQVVREKQEADEQDRKRFASNPMAALSEIYQQERSDSERDNDEEVAEESIENIVGDLFIETVEYSERVIGFGVWRPPILPYIENPKNPWEPETFGIRIAGVYVPLKEGEIPKLQEAVSEAFEKGEPSITFKGETIPATVETLEVLDQLIGLMEPGEGDGGRGHGEGAGNLQYALEIKENFEEKEYAPEFEGRALEHAVTVPNSVTTDLLDHQLEGFKWMVRCYKAGYPGVLNADDQGLGKTLQAVTFLSWLREYLETLPAERQTPFLIVAPTSLLRNWIQEVETHMRPEGLGVRIDAFGSGLRELKREELTGYDTSDESEQTRLDLDLLKANESRDTPYWVLTTYTTLMNYHQSFAEVPFAAVVFDEIQNIKNPASLRHRAAKVVNAEFRFGLTGTPIENTLTDLWSIMDCLSPGRLGSLKEFSARYNNSDRDSLRELHRLVLGDSLEKPALGIRRMKSDEISDLPRKNYRLYSEFMPDEQAMAYDVVFQQLTDGSKGRALKMLHLLRSVSLHPDRVELASGESLESYISHSARLQTTIKIIDDIKTAGESVLVFIENVDMQHAFRQLLNALYGLKGVRIINGATPPERRMDYVNEYQEKGLNEGGFNVMILGPRAAGVGLTLTAATHVIHLSRWWNPAVEEQCNDRIYRIGQHRDVTIHLPMAIHDAYKERSFDCILNNIMQRKRRLSRDTLFPPTDETSDVQDFLNGLYNNETEVLAEIDNGTWQDFENWIIKRMHSSGNWNSFKTPKSGDKGGDGVFVHKDRDQSVIVQAKWRQDPTAEIDASPVHELLHARKHYAVKDPILVGLTNAANFSTSARRAAQENGVILVDRARLCLWPNHIIV